MREGTTRGRLQANIETCACATDAAPRTATSARRAIGEPVTTGPGRMEVGVWRFGLALHPAGDGLT